MEIFGYLTLILHLFLLAALELIGACFYLIEERNIIKDIRHDEVEKTP